MDRLMMEVYSICSSIISLLNIIFSSSTLDGQMLKNGNMQKKSIIDCGLFLPSDVDAASALWPETPHLSNPNRKS